MVELADTLAMISWSKDGVQVANVSDGTNLQAKVPMNQSWELGVGFADLLHKLRPSVPKLAG